MRFLRQRQFDGRRLGIAHLVKRVDEFGVLGRTTRISDLQNACVFGGGAFGSNDARSSSAR